jgi:hypothetical protein
MWMDPYGLEAFKDARGRPCKCKEIKVLQKDFCPSCGENNDKEWGHYWIELGDNESYGWWPTRPVSDKNALTGTAGSMNRGRARDPYHGNRDNLDGSFNPRPMVWPRPNATCEEVCARGAQCIRDVASTYGASSGGSWSLLGNNCQKFQGLALSRCGLGQ